MIKFFAPLSLALGFIFSASPAVAQDSFYQGMNMTPNMEFFPPTPPEPTGLNKCREPDGEFKKQPYTECMKAANMKLMTCQFNSAAARNECGKDYKAEAAKVAKPVKTEGIADSCAKAAEMTTAASDILKGFATKCEDNANSCINSCVEVLKEIEACRNIPLDTPCFESANDAEPMSIATKAAQTCTQEYKPKAAEAKRAVESNKLTIAAADDCGDGSGGTAPESPESSTGTAGTGSGADGDKDKKAKAAGSGMQMPDLSSLFAAQPAATPMPVPTPTPSTGCDNPAVNDRVCQCLRNPAMCQAQASGQPDALGSSGFENFGSTTPSELDPGISGNNFGGLGEMKPSGGPGAEVGGRQGNGAAIGGGDSFSGGGGGGGRGGSAPQPDLNTKVNGGYYGGTNGSKGGGGARSASGARVYSALIDGSSSKAMKPDLKKFLPGGSLDPHRGPASVVGKDGITGPNVFNFDKMRKQFRRLWIEEDSFLNY